MKIIQWLIEVFVVCNYKIHTIELILSKDIKSKKCYAPHRYMKKEQGKSTPNYFKALGSSDMEEDILEIYVKIT